MNFYNRTIMQINNVFKNSQIKEKNFPQKFLFSKILSKIKVQKILKYF